MVSVQTVDGIVAAEYAQIRRKKKSFNQVQSLSGPYESDNQDQTRDLVRDDITNLKRRDTGSLLLPELSKHRRVLKSTRALIPN